MREFELPRPTAKLPENKMYWNVNGVWLTIDKPFGWDKPWSEVKHQELRIIPSKETPGRVVFEGENEDSAHLTLDVGERRLYNADLNIHVTLPKKKNAHVPIVSGGLSALTETRFIETSGVGALSYEAERAKRSLDSSETDEQRFQNFLDAQRGFGLRTDIVEQMRLEKFQPLDEARDLRIQAVGGKSFFAPSEEEKERRDTRYWEALKAGLSVMEAASYSRSTVLTIPMIKEDRRRGEEYLARKTAQPLGQLPFTPISLETGGTDSCLTLKDCSEMLRRIDEREKNRKVLDELASKSFHYADRVYNPREVIPLTPSWKEMSDQFIAESRARILRYDAETARIARVELDRVAAMNDAVHSLAKPISYDGCAEWQKSVERRYIPEHIEVNPKPIAVNCPSLSGRFV